MSIETHWVEPTEESSMGTVVEQSLVHMEEKQVDKEGWQQPSLRIGAVYLNLVGNVGMLSVNMLAQVPEPVLRDPENELPVMVDLMVRDVANEDKDVAWLYDITGDAEGFVGFIFLTHGLTDEDVPARNLLFYSRTQGIFLIYRIKDQKLAAGWIPEADISPEDKVLQALIKMTDLAHFARIRHTLFSE